MVVFRKDAAIMNNTLKVMMIALMAVIWAAGTAQAGYKFKINDAVKGEINFWTQIWYQYAEDASDSNEDDTQVYGLGLNYFFKGHANKLSIDLSSVDQKTATISAQDHLIFTIQLAAGLAFSREVLIATAC